MLCAAHGKNLEVLSIWSPAGRRNVEQESYDEVITEVLRSCKVLQYVPLPFLILSLLSTLGKLTILSLL